MRRSAKYYGLASIALGSMGASYIGLFGLLPIQAQIQLINLASRLIGAWVPLVLSGSKQIIVKGA
jgi:hypothetical protein